jgi:drug/metabolite transporter (DMT)-like permease
MRLCIDPSRSGIEGIANNRLSFRMRAAILGTTVLGVSRPAGFMQLVLFFTVCLIWGATWIALKFGLATVPPLIFAGTRFIAAGGALLLFLRLRGERLFVDKADIGRLAIMTATMVVACYALLFWGTLHVSSGLSAILNLATMPIALLAIGLAAGEETFSMRRAVAILCGTVGLVMLFGQRLATPSSDWLIELLGAIACASSAIVYALGSVLARPMLRRYSITLISGLTTFLGGWALTLIALAAEPGASAALAGDWGTMAWLGWLFLVLFGSLIAYTIYMGLLRDWGPSRAGTYAFVSPIVAVLLGAAVFDERLTLVEGLGMAGMLAGAWLSLMPTKALTVPVAR